AGVGVFCVADGALHEHLLAQEAIVVARAIVHAPDDVGRDEGALAHAPQLARARRRGVAERALVGAGGGGAGAGGAAAPARLVGPGAVHAGGGPVPRVAVGVAAAAAGGAAEVRLCRRVGGAVAADATVVAAGAEVAPTVALATRGRAARDRGRTDEKQNCQPH